MIEIAKGLLAITLALQIQHSNGQAMNLLQRYLKEYFKDYYPSTVRSYTLYGNGQNGPADFQASLPIPFDQTGQVNSLILRSTSDPNLRIPPQLQQIQQKAYMNAAAANGQNGIPVPPIGYPYPELPNNFYPLPIDPNQDMTNFQLQPQASKPIPYYVQAPPAAQGPFVQKAPSAKAVESGLGNEYFLDPEEENEQAHGFTEDGVIYKK